ncbi:MAG TPA: YceH family protein [Tepidisphaeraceae bacterium]|nr:YceH family protein [Tepidisphaeraceae bacterium]
MAIELTVDEARVLGVLIEKEMTTPEGYPLTLNAVVNGANQKNNRFPVMAMTEDAARAALVSLRGKGLAVQLDGHGSRTSKFKHEAGSKLGVTKAELVVLAELMLRGAQTQGELRGRASRMYPIDSLEAVRNTLGQLTGRAEPLVRELPPAAGSRAERYQQVMAAEVGVEETEEVEAEVEAAVGQPTNAERISALEAEVGVLKAALRKLAAQIGAEDPLV